MIQKSVKETAEMLKFLGSFATVTDTVLIDGTVNVLELTQFIPTILGAKSAIEGLKEIPAEIADLDDNERLYLVGTLAESLKITNAKADALVDEGFDLALRLAQFVKKIGTAKRTNA